MITKTSLIPLLAVILAQGAAIAQDDIPLLRPEERKAVDAQAGQFNEALKPALAQAARSTVRIWSGKNRLAYGTVIGDGRKVLTKWSEVARARGGLSVQTGTGEAFAATVSGVHEDEDLAVLDVSISGATLTPVRWATEKPALGAFLAAPQPDGKPAAFGVVSVLERNLRETDQAFLGVMGDIRYNGPGVRIETVTRESGAAAAGLRRGDVILKVGEREISGLLELKNSLVGIAPGTRVQVLARSGGEEKTFDVLLGNRPDLPSFPGDRLRAMERMGGKISRVRDSFASAIQTDMRPQPDQIGGPVVNLDGGVVGITIARADRTRSFVMPAAAVEELLKREPRDPSVAKVRHEETPAMPVPRSRVIPAPGRMMGNPERMRQHLSEMQRLMDFMREEMEALEEPRAR